LPDEFKVSEMEFEDDEEGIEEKINRINRY
jgi:hypothetical protein